MSTKLQLIIALVTVLPTILHAMFPNLFPSVGTFLLGLSIQSWIIIVLVAIVIGQTVFLVKMI